MPVHGHEVSRTPVLAQVGPELHSDVITTHCMPPQGHSVGPLSSLRLGIFRLALEGCADSLVRWLVQWENMFGGGRRDVRSFRHNDSMLFRHSFPGCR